MNALPLEYSKFVLTKTERNCIKTCISIHTYMHTYTQTNIQTKNQSTIN